MEIRLINHLSTVLRAERIGSLVNEERLRLILTGVIFGLVSIGLSENWVFVH